MQRPSRERTGLSPRVRGSGVQTVYESLKKSIVELQREPGAPLDEVTLAEAFEMSRTPIREALKVLAAEGLVELLPNRGSRVTTPSTDEIVNLFAVIAALERLGPSAYHRRSWSLPGSSPVLALES